ncbi:MFS transporter permease [Streptomyces alboflavus]|uniref:MFS transporter permease n=1 Tax=Streptomyces alboflavus TaxID=67267 RepID=A0A1Z1WS32_9ACTN|nr:MFS transporter permease [Streptomyces alboflavus]
MKDTSTDPVRNSAAPPAKDRSARARLLSPRAAVVIVYVAAMCMNGLDSTIVNPALFTIAEDFGRPVSAANAVETAFLVALALTLPVAGWLGDRCGTKRVFLGSLAVFTAASALCGLAQDLPTLIAARAVQGLAAACSPRSA